MTISTKLENQQMDIANGLLCFQQIFIINIEVSLYFLANFCHFFKSLKSGQNCKKIKTNQMCIKD
jgi:hypothetical protein